MESKTLSKAEILKGLTDLRDSPYYTMVQQASDVESNTLLENLLHPDFGNGIDAGPQALSVLGTIRGLRWPKRCLDQTIAALTAEVNAERNPPQPQQQKEEYNEPI